jgi:hypothetical protein
VCAVAFATLGLFVTLFPSIALAAPRHFKTRGASAKVDFGLYSDSACTQNLTSIAWGAISPGDSVIKTVYVKNLGSSQLLLSLLTTNWNPSVANELVALSWNQEGATLAVGQVVNATLRLSVSANASGFTSFSFDFVITGEVWKHHA